MFQTATVISLVVALGSANASNSPPPTPAQVDVRVEAPPPSLAFQCVSDDACPLPAQCRVGRCVVSGAYIDELERGGQARTVAGGVVLGAGVFFGVVSAGLVASAYANGFDRSTAESAYSLGGFAIGALVTGAIVLTVGQVKLHRARVLRESSWVTSQRLASPLVLRF